MEATQDTEEQYDDGVITVAELIYGQGSLSPGGVKDVARVVEGVEIAGKDVLDFGCGIGGPALALAKTYNARSVLGVDIGRTVLARAQQALADSNLEDRVSFRLIQPGLLPLDNGSFDVVFSKDAIVHVEDKAALYREFHRVLRPGGWFVASMWLKADKPDLGMMTKFVEDYPLTLFPASRNTTRQALVAAGFTDIDMRDRTAFFKEWTLRELEQIEGPLGEELVAKTDEEAAQGVLALWQATLAVLESGEFCPTYIRARKPALR